MKKYFQDFITCHDGIFNRFIHIVGFGLIGIGFFSKSLLLVVLGGVVQEMGHFYQYSKTKKRKYDPRFCFKPQLIFAYPLFVLIVLYVILAK